MTGHIKWFINSKNDFGNLLNVNLMHNIKKIALKFDLKNHIWFVEVIIHLPRLKRQYIMSTIGINKIKIDGRILTSSLGGRGGEGWGNDDRCWHGEGGPRCRILCWRHICTAPFVQSETALSLVFSLFSKADILNIFVEYL